ncbi:MAG: hypothetical protein AAF402_03805 [Pseudomonadota bacterium]
MEEEINELRQQIPWYVNNTLSPEERAQFEEGLKKYSQLEDEIEFARAVQHAVAAEDVGSPGAFGLRRLQQSIGNAESVKKAAQPRHMETRNSSRWKWAAIAAAVVVMVQTGVIFNGPGRVEYELLGNREGIQSLQIDFQSGVTLEQVNHLLKEIEGEIISGPSALGIFRIHLKEVETDKELEQVIQTLRGQSTIIKHVSRD